MSSSSRKSYEKKAERRHRVNFLFFVGILVFFIIGMHVLAELTEPEPTVRVEFVLTRQLPDSTCIYAIRVAKPNMKYGFTDSTGRKYSGSIFVPDCPLDSRVYKLVPTFILK